jgi:hypothetical protein
LLDRERALEIVFGLPVVFLLARDQPHRFDGFRNAGIVGTEGLRSDRERGVQLLGGFLEAAEIIEEHAFVMQNAGIVHVVGALLPLDHPLELLRDGEAFLVAGVVGRLAHLRRQRVDGTRRQGRRLTDR